MVPTNRTTAPQTTGASASASASTSASTNEEDGKEKEGNDAGVIKRKASASPSSPEKTTNEEEQQEEQKPQQQQQQHPNPPSQKKQRSKRKKAKDGPKRPLSAYNFFFKYERLRILESLKKLSKNINTSASIDLSESEVDEAGVQDLPTQHHQQQLLQLSSEEQEVLVKDGKVSFEEMGRMCGRRWKDVSPEERRIYEEHARNDAERYKREKREYNERKNRVVFSRDQQHPHPFPPRFNENFVDVTRQQNIQGNETSYAPSSYHGQHLNYPQSYGHYPYQHHTRSYQDLVGDNSSSLVGHSSPGYISSPSHRYPHYHQYTPQPQFNAQTSSPVYNHLEYPNNPYPVISSSPPPRQYHQTISPTMTTLNNNNNTSDISVTQPLSLSPVSSHPPPYPPPSSYTPYSYNTNRLQQQHQATENSNNNNEETTIHPDPLPPSSPVLPQHGHHFFANSVHNHLDQEHQQYSQQRVLHQQQQYNNRQHTASYSSTQAQWPPMSQQTSSSTTGGDQEIKKEKDENSSFTF